MARISNRSVVVIPAALIGTAALGFAWWTHTRLTDVETKAIRSIDDRAALNKSVDAIESKLDAIPRIQEDVEWIRAEMGKRAGDAGPGDQARR